MKLPMVDDRPGIRFHMIKYANELFYMVKVTDT